jgi:hypothetical protein
LAIILSVLFDGNVEDGCVAEVVATRWRMTYMKTLFRRESLSDLRKSKLHSARVGKMGGRIKELCTKGDIGSEFAYHIVVSDTNGDYATLFSHLIRNVLFVPSAIIENLSWLGIMYSVN